MFAKISAKTPFVQGVLIVILLTGVFFGIAIKNQMTPALAAPLVSEDWPMYQHDLQRSGRTASDINNNGPLYLQWAYAFGERVEIEVQPIVSNGVIYTGSMNGEMHALNALTGELIWRVRPGGPIAHSAAVANGNVYFGSLDGSVYALSAADGSLIWQFETGGPVMSAPAVAEGRLLIGSNDGNLYSLSPSNGAELWRVGTGGPVVSSPAVANGMVYFGSEDLHARAVNLVTGNVVWSTPLSGAGMHNMHPVISDNGNVVIFLTVKPGGNAYVPEEDYPDVSIGANPVETWNDFYLEHPERRYLHYLNANTGVDLWNPTSQLYVPIPIPYWGLLHPILGDDGFAWFPAPSGADGHNFSLDHDNRLFKVNLSSGSATQVAGEGSPHEFQIAEDEVGRHTFAGGDYYYTRSEDLGVYRPGDGFLRTLFSNGDPSGYNMGSHMDPLSPLPSRHLWRYGGAVAMGGVPGASQPILANGMVYYISYGWLYAVSTTNHGYNPATSFPSRDARLYELTYPRSSTPNMAEMHAEVEQRIADLIALGPHNYPITARWEQTDKAMPHNEFRFEVYGFEADLVRVLSEAYPHLPATQQSQLKNYLITLANNTVLNPDHYTYSTSCVIFGESGVQSGTDYCRAGEKISAYWWNINPNLNALRLYAIWAYADATGQWSDVQSKWNSLIVPEFHKYDEAYDDNLGFCQFDEWYTKRLNIGAQIAMAQAVRDMAAQVGDTSTQNSAQSLLDNLLIGRVKLGEFIPWLYDAGLRTPAPIRLRPDGTINNDDIMTGGPYNGDMIPYHAELRDRYSDVSQVNWLEGSLTNPSNYRVDAGLGFMHYQGLSGYYPLSESLNTLAQRQLLGNLQEFVKSYEVNNPWWWMSDLAHHTTGSGEHLYHSPTLAWTMFQTKAWILQDDWDTLAHQLPEPVSFNAKYDLYRLQNLVTLLTLADVDLNATSKIVSVAIAESGDDVNYTITIRNKGSALDTPLTLVDILPEGLTYVPGTLETTLGTVDDSNLPELHWSGVLGTISEVIITYETIADVPKEEVHALENTATLSGDGIPSIMVSAVIIVNGEHIFLPLIIY